MTAPWESLAWERARSDRIPLACIATLRDGQLSTMAASGSDPGAVPVDVPLPIGSITKLFTANIATRVLARVTGDDEVSTAALLNHTSGLAGDFTPRDADSLASIHAYTNAVLDQPRRNQGAFSYCNAGFVVLAERCEEATGRSWSQLLYDEITKPLGLRSFDPYGYRHDGLATWAYTDDGEIRRRPLWSDARCFAPAGSTPTSSAADVLAFAATAVADATKASDWLSVPGTPYEQASMSGGWFRYRWIGGDLFGHDGGSSASVRVTADGSTGIAVITTAGHGRAFCRAVTRAFFASDGMRPPWAGVAAVPNDVGERAAGSYGSDGAVVVLRHASEYERIVLAAPGILGDREPLLGSVSPANLADDPTDVDSVIGVGYDPGVPADTRWRAVYLGMRRLDRCTDANE